MALATKCPHCNTIFRVAADQLKLRGGIVRCGACHEVFDGNAALVEPAAKPTPVIPEVPTATAAGAAEPAAPEYVSGSGVDFELDFSDDAGTPHAADIYAGEASAPGSSAAHSAPETAAPPPLAAPSVWRTSAASSPAEEPPLPAAAPSPEELAQAAVARAFAAVTAPATTAPDMPPSEMPSASDLGTPRDEEPSASELDTLPGEAASAAESDSPRDGLPSAGELAAPPGEETPATAEAAPESDFVPAFLRTRSAPVEAHADVTAAPAEEASPADEAAHNLHPDGRIEPTLDTPQEHIVVAALDDAHHFEDLPQDEQSTPEPSGQHEASEPSLGEESWSAPAAGPLPAEEPWSLSEPEPEPELEPERDETALHAVAAVNTDAPDDGESLPDDETPGEEPATSRRARALKRAKSRRDASGPAQQATGEGEGEGEADASATGASAGEGADDEAAAQAAARMRALAGIDESGAELDHSDLSFVKRVDRSQKYGKAIKLTMAIGIPVLLAGLVLQAATTFRDALAANYPQLKPALAALCQPLGCKVALPAQLDALSIEQGELASMAENTFTFSTVLRNQSKTPQAWPHIELTLNDNADKPVLRRVFAPREYLPSPAEAEKGFGPRSEQSIKLYFELKELKASGYHIAIFYP